MRRIFALLLGAAIGVFAQPVQAALVGRSITIVPTPSGALDLRFLDGNDGGSPPTAPELGVPVIVSHTTVDVPLAVAATGGTGPYTYELSKSTDPFCVTAFTVHAASAVFDTDGIYRITGLTANTRYCLRLVAIDAVPARSGPSAIQVVTTPVEPPPPDVTAPTVPTGLNCTSTIEGQVDCTWNASTDAVGVTCYNIVRGIGDGNGVAVGTGSIIGTLTGAPPVTNFSDIGLTPATEVYHRISACDAAGNTSAVTARDFTDVAENPDPPPQGLSDTPDYEDPLEGVTLQGGRTTVNSTDSADFAADINAAACGQTIVAPSGNMTNAATQDTDCPENNPVIITGQAAFASKLRFSLLITGNQTIIHGLDVDNAASRIRVQAINAHVLGNKIHAWGDTSTCNAIAVSALQHSTAVPSKQIEVAYNEIYSPGPWHSTPASCGVQGRQGIRTSENGSSNFHYNGWVHHNYVHDFPPKPKPEVYDSGQDDWLEVGQTQQGTMTAIDAQWWIEDNLVVRHYQGHGVYDAKTGGNVFRRNTMLDSRTTTTGSNGQPVTLNSRTDNRTGSTHRSIFEANWNENSSGMTIHGTVSLYGNRLVNSATGYKILAGTSLCGTDNCQSRYPPGEGQQPCKHANACEVILEGNVGNVSIGDKDATSACEFPARNTTVWDHKGGGVNPVSGCHTGTVENAGPSGRLYQSAVKLTTADVGPAKMATAPAAWKAARGIP